MDDDNRGADGRPEAVRQCSEEGCNQPARTRGMCKVHYGRWHRYSSRRTIICEQCGREVEDAPSNKRFCSRLCFERYRVSWPKKRECRECGAEFEVQDRSDANRRYCSPKCRDERTRVVHANNPVTLCLAGNCENPVASHGLCNIHWQRMRRRGKTDDLAPRERKPWVGLDGYVLVKVEGSRSPKSVHRLIMEQRLGRPLRPGETVHHKNGIRSDNRDENLELWASWQPSGSRVSDLLEYAREVLRVYGGEEDLL